MKLRMPVWETKRYGAYPELIGRAVGAPDVGGEVGKRSVGTVVQGFASR